VFGPDTDVEDVSAPKDTGETPGVGASKGFSDGPGGVPIPIGFSGMGSLSFSNPPGVAALYQFAVLEAGGDIGAAESSTDGACAISVSSFCEAAFCDIPLRFDDGDVRARVLARVFAFKRRMNRL